MRISATLTAAALLAAPALAQNDECAMATSVVAGSFAFDTSTATLSAQAWPCAGGGPDLWYAYTSTVTGNVSISLCGSTYDTALEVFTGTCNALTSLACNDDSCGLQSGITFAATSGTTYTFRIGGWNNSVGSGTCTINDGTPILNPANGHYYLAVEQVGITWDQARMDAAATSFMGVPGHLITISDAAEQAFSTSMIGNVQNYWLGGFQNTSSPTYSEPAGGWEWITGEPWTYTQWWPGEPNNTGSFGAEDYLEYLNGDWNDAAQMEHPRGYVIEYPLGLGIGTNYCMANPNSTGSAASMSASGSAVAADDDLTLNCSDMPNNAFGFFLTSAAQAFTPNPGGSQGNLCIGGSIGRYVGTGQIQNSGSMGEISLLLSLPNTPTPNGFVAVQAGDTRNFQCWFRDSSGGMAVSNFSDGLEIQFL